MSHRVGSRPVSRPRRGMEAKPLKKISLRLDARLVAAVRAVVETGGAASVNAFVEAAVIEALRERRRQHLYAAYAEAAADPAFQADMASSTQD